MFFNVLFWVPFGFHFGGVFGAQMDAKSMNKWFPKVIQKHVRFLIDFGVPEGPKMEQRLTK